MLFLVKEPKIYKMTEYFLQENFQKMCIRDRDMVMARAMSRVKNFFIAITFPKNKLWATGMPVPSAAAGRRDAKNGPLC